MSDKQAQIDEMWEQCGKLWEEYKQCLNKCDRLMSEARKIYAERDKLMKDQRADFV